MIEQSLADSLIDPGDPPQHQIAKLKVIAEKLMFRVEQAMADPGQGYFYFERAIALEDQVRQRTQDLQEALDVVHTTNAQLTFTQREAEAARRNLSSAIEAIGEGFAIFDAKENLLMKNSRFLAQLPDIADQLHQGSSFASYVALCAQSKLLKMPSESDTNVWIAQRLAAHQQNRVNISYELTNGEWMQVSEQRTEDGSTIILQTDITDLVLLQHDERTRMLDRQAQLVKETLDHLEQAVLIFDEKGQLAEWNRPAVTTLNLAPYLLNKGTRIARFADVFSPGQVFTGRSVPEDIYSWLCTDTPRTTLRRELEASNGDRYALYCCEIADGSVLLVFTDITNIRNAHAELRQINETLEQRVLARTDELQAARDQAELANAAKSRFIAAVSHDLLQPINAAKLFISALHQTELNARQLRIVEQISKSFNSVSSILTALLDISRLDSGKAVLNISEFQISTILERLEEEFGVLAKAKGLRLSIVASSLLVRSDPVYLRRILQNLVSNAVRYTEQGRISVGIRRRKSHFDLYVTDTGMGIAAEEQPNIFKEFYRSTLAHHEEGAMGLGLAVVERACQMLEYDLELKSVLGQGTQFRLSLPYVRASTMLGR